MADVEKLKTAIKGAIAVGVADLFMELDLLPLDSRLREELAMKEAELARVITEGSLRALKLSLEIEVFDISLDDALLAADALAAELVMSQQPPVKL